ncbi:hypothetical protein [uncultured Amnibacterium sp.]
MDGRVDLQRPCAAGNLDELARLQTHFWLDGPTQPELIRDAIA